MKTFTPPQLVSAIVCLFCLGLLGLTLFVPAKGANQLMVIGAIITGFTSSLSFFIGTTVGSAAKDDANKTNTASLIDALANSTPIEKNV